MENLLVYVISTLLRYDYSVSPRQLSEFTNRNQWIVHFADRVNIVFDDNDVKVLRFIVEMSNDDEDVERISKLLTKLV